ncbi:uncharacterized protein LOC141728621 [Zonotrichia albicollis]|uniref:uncharacterized protein LOC141728621 n=1 Tax=Zonotrichia albicollis TaxID=44394 RepID=UPI003D80D2E6
MPQPGGLGSPAARPTGAAAGRFEKPPAVGAARATEQRDNMEEMGERRGSREASGARGQGGGRGRAALTGIWLLIEDCSLIIQPGCGRHRRGQEEQNQEEEEEEALEAAELPAGVRRRRGEEPYSGCGGRAALRAAPGGRGCTRSDTRRRLPHERPAPPLARVTDERRARPINGASGASGAGARPRGAGRRRSERAREAEAAGGNRFGQ